MLHLCSVSSSTGGKKKKGTLAVYIQEIFSSFLRKRDLSLAVRERTKSDPSRDEESYEISRYRPSAVHLNDCMLFLSPDDES